MAELISFFALCISLLIFFVHYRNQVERRHGEIAKLRSDALQRVSATQHRMKSIQMHIETVRIELRHMGDCIDKYDSIEQMPSLIKDTQETTNKLLELENGLKGLDTVKKNKSVFLMALQSTEHAFHDLEEETNKLEKMVLKLLTQIRLEQDKTDQQQIEQNIKAQQDDTPDPRFTGR